jgi:outer membrane protein assembly factor BamD
MRINKNRFFWGLFLMLFLTASLSGCSWLWPKRQLEMTPEASFDRAMQLFSKKKYEKAAESFKQFKEDFPLSNYTPLAELRTADCYYFDKKYAEAIPLYEEFKKLHPLHQEIPFVIYQLGMCHFQQINTIDRDQTETEKAIEQFRYLVENFPQSPHASEAKKNLENCQGNLAEHEFYIGNFYYRTDRYKAARGRLAGILQNYPQTPRQKEIKRLIEECDRKIAKEEQERKEKEAREEKKKKARAENKG